MKHVQKFNVKFEITFQQFIKWNQIQAGPQENRIDFYQVAVGLYCIHQCPERMAINGSSMISVHMSSDRDNADSCMPVQVIQVMISVPSCRQCLLNKNEWQLRKKLTTQHSQAELDQTLTSCPDCSCLMMPQGETQGRPNLPRPSQTSGLQEFSFQKVLWCR